MRRKTTRRLERFGAATTGALAAFLGLTGCEVDSRNVVALESSTGENPGDVDAAPPPSGSGGGGSATPDEVAPDEMVRVPDGGLGACQGAVLPARRNCASEADNDCDGSPDNTVDDICQCVPGLQRDCGIEDGSQGCSRGTQTCEIVAGGNGSLFGECVFTAVTDGTACDDEDPQTVADDCQAGTCSGARVGVLATGPNSACAIRSGGAVYCWTDSDGPFERIDLPQAAVSVSVGDFHACAVMNDRSVRCWGSNGLGTLGNGTTEASTEGVVATGLLDVTQVLTGSNNSAAVTGNGSVFLWGAYDEPSGQRQLFGVEAPPLASAVTVPIQIGQLGQVVQLGLGPRHACAALGSGQVVCWGRNDFSQLGRPTLGNDDAQATTSIVDGVNDAVGVASGDSYNCALRATGEVACWGSLFTSDLSSTQNLPPAQVPQLSDVAMLSVGSSSACALRRDNTIACWGGNAFGELGTGSFNGTLIPQTVVGVNGGVLDDALMLSSTAALGGRAVCALRRNGSIACWGTITGTTTPVAVAVPN
jgi:Regulator of chromosome condensation (RCC1) repeat